MGVVILIIVLFIGGIWGVIMNLYDELEKLIFMPILRLIANQESKSSLLVFLPVSILFMIVRRAVTYAPLWVGLYILMTTYGYSVIVTYKTIAIFIACMGCIKAAEVIKVVYTDKDSSFGRHY